MSERTREIAFQQLVVHYLPRGAMRVLEDVRLADPDYLQGAETAPDDDLKCLLAGL